MFLSPTRELSESGMLRVNTGTGQVLRLLQARKNVRTSTHGLALTTGRMDKRKTRID